MRTSVRIASCTDVQLYLDSPYYGAYPFDVQALTIELQSSTLPSNRLSLTAIDSLCGFDSSYTHTWPGWEPSPEPVVPGGQSGAAAIWAAGTGLQPRWPRTQRIKNLLFPQSDACASDVDARSVFVLSIAVKRIHNQIVSGMPRATRNGAHKARRLGQGIHARMAHTRHVLAGSIIPLLMLVCISWASFFVNVRFLMPRVAVGFISFLTLSNWAATRARVPYASLAAAFVISFMCDPLCAHGVLPPCSSLTPRVRAANV